jgi:hypothetical protein
MSNQTSLIPTLKSMYPNIVQVAKLYNDTYPHETTPPEVIDAVTVAVPLRTFMVMSALVAQTLAASAAVESAPPAEGHCEASAE